MSNKPTLNKVPFLESISIQTYESYLPSAFDESLSILQKINKVIYQLNKIGINMNDLTENWNNLIQWILGDGLTEIVSEEIDRRINDGEFDELIYRIVGDLTELTTINKENLVEAINEINEILKETNLNIGDVNDLQTNSKIIVDAINEIKITNDINNQSVIALGEATGYGIISGLEVKQQNVLSMAVDVGNSTVENIIHMPNGERYVIGSQSIAINESDSLLNRIDVIYVSENGEIKYQAGQPNNNPIQPVISDSSVLLAIVNVLAADTTINNVDIIDKREIKSLEYLLTENKINFVQSINEIVVNIVKLNEVIVDNFNQLTNDILALDNKLELEVDSLLNIINDNDNAINQRLNELDLKIETDIANQINDLTDLISLEVQNLTDLISSNVQELEGKINDLDISTKNSLNQLTDNLDLLKQEYEITKDRLLVSDSQPTNQYKSDVWVQPTEENTVNNYKNVTMHEKSDNDYTKIYPKTTVEQVLNLDNELDHKVDKGDIFLSAKEFGAIGDGVTDDSLALQEWLNHPNKYKILTNGVYATSKPLTLNNEYSVVKTDGAIIKAISLFPNDNAMLTVKSNGCNISLNLEGSMLASTGILVEVGGCNVNNSVIKNFLGFESNGVGIRANTHEGITIENNHIENIQATDDGIFANDKGAPRGILVNGRRNATGTSIIRNNTVKDVLNEEGDAIQILFYDGVTHPFLDSKSIIQNNLIINATRRAIKIQGANCDVISNVFKNYLTENETINGASAINIIQSDNVTVIDNIVDAKLMAGIMISGSSTMKIKNIVIKNNTIYSAFLEQTATRNRTNGIFFDNCDTFMCISAYSYTVTFKT